VIVVSEVRANEKNLLEANGCTVGNHQMLPFIISSIHYLNKVDCLLKLPLKLIYSNYYQIQLYLH